jgi:hypothetical protein
MTGVGTEVETVGGTLWQAASANSGSAESKLRHRDRGHRDMGRILENPEQAARSLRHAATSESFLAYEEYKQTTFL